MGDMPSREEVLLAVALYAVIRWKVVVDAAIGAGFTNRLLIALGVASLAIAALSVVLQRNYKRMLAYSSIEHTGLMCVGLALGPLGAFATFLHLINHTAAKSLMFILAGRLADRYQTTEISSVSGFLKVMPWTAALFTIGMMATLGLPPFGMFVSEFALIRAGFAADSEGSCIGTRHDGLRCPSKPIRLATACPHYCAKPDR